MKTDNCGTLCPNLSNLRILMLDGMMKSTSLKEKDLLEDKYYKDYSITIFKVKASLYSFRKMAVAQRMEKLESIGDVPISLIHMLAGAYTHRAVFGIRYGTVPNMYEERVVVDPVCLILFDELIVEDQGRDEPITLHNLGDILLDLEVEPNEKVNTIFAIYRPSANADGGYIVNNFAKSVKDFTDFGKIKVKGIDIRNWNNEFPYFKIYTDSKEDIIDYGELKSEVPKEVEEAIEHGSVMEGKYILEIEDDGCKAYASDKDRMDRFSEYLLNYLHIMTFRCDPREIQPNGDGTVTVALRYKFEADERVSKLVLGSTHTTITLSIDQAS